MTSYENMELFLEYYENQWLSLEGAKNISVDEANLRTTSAVEAP